MFAGDWFHWFALIFLITQYTTNSNSVMLRLPPNTNTGEIIFLDLLDIFKQYNYNFTLLYSTVFCFLLFYFTSVVKYLIIVL